MRYLYEVSCHVMRHMANGQRKCHASIDIRYHSFRNKFGEISSVSDEFNIDTVR